MRIVFALLLLGAAPFVSAAEDLSRRIVANEGWVSWQVPRVADAGDSCCHTIHGDVVSRRGCDLDGRQWNINSSTGGDAGHLVVYAHVRGGVVDKIRAFSATCPVRTAEPLRAIDGVDPAASVNWLAEHARRERGKKDDDEAIAALASHATPVAMTALRDLAAPERPEKQRQAALFWMGQARGAEGVNAVERYARDDADADIREHAVFVLSQAAEHGTYPRILAIAGSDRSAEVRGQALFWLAQMEDPRAGADIIAAIRRETDPEAREQAVFALSQLDDDEGDKALIAVIRGDFPREVKQKAVFWLGQSGSDTAIAFLDDVLK
ncbi:MAG TPA: HEAT repeat domain-containing protein [Tahibacter sp.]|uniref:HEAT repeat domain-containing protein n=1 Tax=Tahibacter sp. TaxID=2056211 RepID=UPI002BE782F7|nr:HEAT repeat domain-containing protein [Tahibacter sp.]HSX60105.1 HEAT repeat domain-containing protein [Tahibacter sp.]